MSGTQSTQESTELRAKAVWLREYYYFASLHSCLTLVEAVANMNSMESQHCYTARPLRGFRYNLEPIN